MSAYAGSSENLKGLKDLQSFATRGCNFRVSHPRLAQIENENALILIQAKVTSLYSLPRRECSLNMTSTRTNVLKGMNSWLAKKHHEDDGV